MTLKEKAFENIVEKQMQIKIIFFFSQYVLILPVKRLNSSIQKYLICSLQILSILSCLKFCHLVKKKSEKKAPENISGKGENAPLQKIPLLAKHQICRLQN